MKTAIFTNITSEPFVGFWDGKKKTYAPGARKLIPAYLAEHYATHLTNKILIEQGEYTSTSPKKPEDVPKFIELFKKICQPQDDDEDEDEVEMPTRNVPKVRTSVDSAPPQYIGSPEEGVSDDETFEGMNNNTETEE